MFKTYKQNNKKKKQFKKNKKPIPYWKTIEKFYDSHDGYATKKRK